MMDALINKKIIINSDIDGLLSGLILKKYLNCDLAGFSNSHNCVWIDKSRINSIYDAVYIDMFITNKNVICLDQHIVSVNSFHHEKLKKNPNKINPNIINPRFHVPSGSYYKKYPFGTVHFIIAMLEREGVIVDFEWNKIISSDLKLIDLLLRADDAMKTTVHSNYTINAREWWNWLRLMSDNSKSINLLINYLNSLTPTQANDKKRTATNILQSVYNCESSDGGFKNITDQSGILLPHVVRYFKFVEIIMGGSGFFDGLVLTPQHGTVNRVSLSQDQVNELINYNKINGKEIFSYAFVRSKQRDQNFSYTIM